MRKQGVELNLKMTIESNEAIRHAAMSGLGVSILSSHTLSYGGRTGLQELAVDTLPIVLHWHFARLRNKRMSIIASTFLDYLTQQGQKALLEEIAREQPQLSSLFASARADLRVNAVPSKGQGS